MSKIKHRDHKKSQHPEYNKGGIEDIVINILKKKSMHLISEGIEGKIINKKTVIEDDCASIEIDNRNSMVVGIDFIRGAGFRLFNIGKLSYRDIGYYLVSANISDVVAMGAVPIGFLDVLRYTNEINLRDIEEIINGMVDACKDFKTPLLGGDTGSYDNLVLAGVGLGIVETNNILLRTNAKPGDALYVSGYTGVAGMANLYFGREIEGILSKEDEDTLLSCWKRPAPELSLAKQLSKRKFSNCGIDTSDGLRSAIEQLAKASNVTFYVHLERIPIHPIIKKYFYKLFKNKDRDYIYNYIFSDSVDFKLLFTVPASKIESFELWIDKGGWEVYKIGECKEREGNINAIAINQKGEKLALPGVPWDHSRVETFERIDRIMKG